MRTTQREIPYLPEDNCLPEYENAVYHIALQRVVRLLFINNQPISISEIIRATNISINSLAASYIELHEKGYAEQCGHKIHLNHSGRQWAMRERRNIFMKRVTVKLKRPPSIATSNSKNLLAAIEGRTLPKTYRL